MNCFVAPTFADSAELLIPKYSSIRGCCGSLCTCVSVLFSSKWSRNLLLHLYSELSCWVFSKGKSSGQNLDSGALYSLELFFPFARSSIISSRLPCKLDLAVWRTAFRCYSGSGQTALSPRINRDSQLTVYCSLWPCHCSLGDRTPTFSARVSKSLQRAESPQASCQTVWVRSRIYFFQPPRLLLLFSKSIWLGRDNLLGQVLAQWLIN